MTIKIGFAGDRQIAVEILSYIIEQGVIPSILLVSDNKNNSHSQELVSICKFLNPDYIIGGSKIADKKSVEKIKKLDLDYLICIHFPYIIPDIILNCVNIGVLNLHPAYLPYNRGWHTPTWAILDKTPFGATLHFMDKSLDTGDIIHQKKLEIFPEDTANTLYQKVLPLEIEIFKEAWPTILNTKICRISQKNVKDSSHKKQDIKKIQKIDLNESINVGNFLNLLKSLTTNNIEESAFFEKEGTKYHVQVKIIKDNPE